MSINLFKYFYKKLLINGNWFCFIVSCKKWIHYLLKFTLYKYEEKIKA